LTPQAAPAILRHLKYPKRRADLETRTADDEVILLDVAGNRVHRLNRSASFIWDCCDGVNSPSEIAARLAGTYELSADAVMNDVDSVLAEFERLGLLTDRP